MTLSNDLKRLANLKGITTFGIHLQSPAPGDRCGTWYASLYHIDYSADPRLTGPNANTPEEATEAFIKQLEECGLMEELEVDDEKV